MSQEMRAFLDYLSGGNADSNLTHRIEEKIFEAKRNTGWKEDSKTVELKKANPEEVVEVQPEPEQKPEPQFVLENIEEEPQEAAHSSLPYIYIAVGVLAVLLGAILVIKKKRNSR